MRKETITLGGRSYVVGELPLRKARAYRDMLKEKIGGVIALLESAPNVELKDTAVVGAMLRGLSETLLNSTDTAAELLYAYSEDIAKDQAWIEENAVGSEVVDATFTLLTMVFPFLAGAPAKRLMTMIQSSGSPTNPT